MTGTTKRVAVYAALLALSGLTIACGDDDDAGTDAAVTRDAGRDSGSTPETDSGTDAGTEETDSGAPDAGMPAAALRLAHLISNVQGTMGAVHICLAATPAQQVLLTSSSGPVPYRGVSPYTNLVLGPLTYTVRVYPAAAVTANMCPAAGSPEYGMALIANTINATMLESGKFYTIAAAGLIDGTGPTEAQLVVIEDTRIALPAGQTGVRIVHALANLPVPAVDVCHDPDFVIGAGGPEPGEAPAVPIARDASFIGAAQVGDPPAATVVADLTYEALAPITTGFVFIYARTAGDVDCATANPATALVRFPVPIPVPPAGTPGVPPALVAGGTWDDQELVSVFAVGNAAFAGTGVVCAGNPTACDSLTPAGFVCQNSVCQHPQGPTVLPYIDNCADIAGCAPTP